MADGSGAEDAPVCFTKLSINVLGFRESGPVQERAQVPGEGGGAASSRLQPQGLQTPQCHLVPVARLLRQPQAAQTGCQQFLEGHASLEPRQRRAKAVVDAPPKGKMVGGGAAHVQPVRAGKGLRIAIGCSKEADHPLSGGYPLPAQLNRLARYPVVQLHRTVKTQKFVNRTVQQRGVVGAVSGAGPDCAEAPGRRCR